MNLHTIRKKIIWFTTLMGDFFFVKQFESSSGLKVILLHFDPLKLQKKQQQIIKL